MQGLGCHGRQIVLMKAVDTWKPMSCHSGPCLDLRVTAFLLGACLLVLMGLSISGVTTASQPLLVARQVSLPPSSRREASLGSTRRLVFLLGGEDAKNASSTRRGIGVDLMRLLTQALEERSHRDKAALEPALDRTALGKPATSAPGAVTVSRLCQTSQLRFTRSSFSVGSTAGAGAGTASISESDATASPSFKAPVKEIDRRRNFAIISHPDAGKTTLTEKLLLNGGAIQSAGAVKQRANQRAATSDWMEIEKQRGISITSTVLTFEYADNRVNLLDTPGHQDFSEDTYRTLAAADNAVMVIDGAKGLEPQTRKLFEVARMRKLPIFTFVNKMDRPALSPFQIIDEIEKEFELPCCPIVWPIGDGDTFQGVVDIATKEVYLFKKGDRTKKALKDMTKIPLESKEAADRIPEDLYLQVTEDVDIVAEMTPPCDINQVLSGDISPLFFGSAMNDFGVELFLTKFLDLAQRPKANEIIDGEIEASHPEFSALIFKLQANLNPRHRDCMAFARICSGTFKKGMKVKNSRLGDRQLTLSQAQLLFASDRDSVDTAYPGDVIGLNNPSIFAIGDTLYTGSKQIQYPGIPSFSPEMFKYIRATSPGSYKSFNKGLQQLLDEGTVQMLRAKDDAGSGAPILAAVGQLQFDVVQTRLVNEYSVESALETLPYSVARWVTDGWEALDACGPLYSAFVAKDRWDRPVLLFKSDWALNTLMAEQPKLRMTPWAFAPTKK